MTILYVDDVEDERKLATDVLKENSYNIIEAENPIKALEVIENDHVDLIISDFKMTGMNGIEFLKEAKKINPVIPFILVTQYGNTELAVKVIKSGGAEFLDKPINFQKLIYMVKNIEKEMLIENELRKVKQSTENDIDLYNKDIIYKSEVMKKLLSSLPRYAQTDFPVLITGESGTGKELIADLIHSLSKRKNQEYITINSAAIPENLIESELFGYEKGSFTGAGKKTIGKIESANHGTIFLDEIAEMPMTLQSKLLRLLEQGEIQRIGEYKSKKVDIRIISATNKDLTEMIKDGYFRKDLFYRLNTIHIEIPPLRERKEEIIPIAEHFIKEIARDYNRKIKVLTSKAKKKLASYNYPGNVRELRNLIQSAMVVTFSDIIDDEDIYLHTGKPVEINKDDIYNEYDDICTEFLNNLFHTSDKTKNNDSNTSEDELKLYDNIHYKIVDDRLILYTTKCLDILDKLGFHYDRIMLLKKLREKNYLINNDILTYFDGVRKRAWELDLKKIHEDNIYIFIY